MFAALVSRRFIFLFLQFLNGLCCHSLELQFNMETNSDSSLRLERRCWPDRAAHWGHHLLQSARVAQTPLTVPSKKPTSHRSNKPPRLTGAACLQAYPFPRLTCSAVPPPPALSVQVQGPQNNQVWAVPQPSMVHKQVINGGDGFGGLVTSPEPKVVRGRGLPLVLTVSTSL